MVKRNQETTTTKLKRISDRSKNHPEATFKWLVQHFNKSSLLRCYQELDARKAIGVDGMRKDRYGKKLSENLEGLLKRMKQMRYKPGPIREVEIPKEGKANAYRTLGISNFEDKIVQSMTRKILEAIYEPIFRDCSFGFRPKRSCHMAIGALDKHLYGSMCEVVIDVDLKNFFGTLDHKILLEFLRMKIKDERFIRYIARMLKAGVLTDGELRITEEGSPQGNIASPILANIYAHYAIDVWFQDVVKNHVGGSVEMYRYCDDMVICCQYRADAERIMKALPKRLAKFGLSLNQEKTKVVSFDKRALRRGEKQGTFDFLGFTFYWGKSYKGFIIPKMKTSRSRMKTKLRKVKDWMKSQRCMEKLPKLWEIFRAKLRGHIQYYAVSHNLRFVEAFIRKATMIFLKWINRRSQKKSLNREKFWLFVNKYPLPKVRVHHAFF